MTSRVMYYAALPVVTFFFVLFLSGLCKIAPCLSSNYQVLDFGQFHKILSSLKFLAYSGGIRMDDVVGLQSCELLETVHNAIDFTYFQWQR